MRNHLVVDKMQERAIDYVKKLNHPREMESYVEYENEAIIFYEDKKFFITNQISNSIYALPIYAVHLHGQVELSQEEEVGLHNALIKVHGVQGVDREFSHIHRY